MKRDELVKRIDYGEIRLKEAVLHLTRRDVEKVEKILANILARLNTKGIIGRRDALSILSELCDDYND